MTLEGRDYHAWAKFPASVVAFEYVKKIADDGDYSFRVIYNRHVGDGNVSSDGKFLRIWRNKKWTTP
jgi:hypothetical protein